MEDPLIEFVKAYHVLYNRYPAYLPVPRRIYNQYPPQNRTLEFCVRNIASNMEFIDQRMIKGELSYEEAQKKIAAMDDRDYFEQVYRTEKITIILVPEC